jgi:hypothetical protein
MEKRFRAKGKLLYLLQVGCRRGWVVDNFGQLTVTLSCLFLRQTCILALPGLVVLPKGFDLDRALENLIAALAHDMMLGMHLDSF